MNEYDRNRLYNGTYMVQPNPFFLVSPLCINDADLSLSTSNVFSREENLGRTVETVMRY